LLGTALLSCETPAANLIARDQFLEAVELAADSYDRSRALAMLGKALLRLSDIDGARERLRQALEEDSSNRDAYKRLASIDLEANRDREAFDHAEQMVANGIAHPRVLAIRVLALAKTGRISEARCAAGFEAFMQSGIPAPPSGWSSIEAFNADLAQELLSHPGIRFNRYGAASNQTWRVDEPALARSKLYPALQRLILREAASYVAALPDKNNPWLQARPQFSSLRSWCVMTDSEGFEEWHVHQNGWLSGAYYVDVPDFIVSGKGEEGCIEFSLPPGIVGEARKEAFGSHFFRPKSGLLMMFPSHSFHRTFAHKGNKRRICVAFDFIPVANTLAA